MGWPGPMTHRQFIAWCAWDGMQWNRPDRIEFYIMRLIAEVRRGWVKHPEQVDEREFKVSFTQTKEEMEGTKPPASPKKEPTQEGSGDPQFSLKNMQTTMAKQAWFARLNINPDGTPKEKLKRG
jgi:hypothetical protein